MKVKLLKKVRKRFEIRYFPKGFIRLGIYFKGESIKLYDNENSFMDTRFLIEGSYTKEMALDKCMKTLLRHLRKDYSKYSRKHKQVTSNKIWYK